MRETPDIQRLVEVMRRVEDRSRGGGGPANGRSAVLGTGWPAVDAAVAGGLRCGCVHEWFGDDGGPLRVFEHLARRARRAAAPRGHGWVVWVGRACWPYPWALCGSVCKGDGDENAAAEVGTDVLAGSLWVNPPDAGSRLWAIDLAARCAGVAMVVADGSGLTMSATRRLQLAAQAGGTPVVLGRPWRERDRLSAAATRWRVVATPSPNERPRWQLRLMRCKTTDAGARAGTGTGTDPAWHLEWDDAAGAVHLAADVGDRSVATPSATAEASRDRDHERGPRGPREPAIVLTTVRRGRQVVAHVCHAARAAGVVPGMDVAHARALLPTESAESAGRAEGTRAKGTRVEPHDARRDAAALHALARWAMRFSPVVAVDPPDGLLLDIAGCQRLFGGERPLLARVRDGVRALGFAARVAIAPTVGGAWALARFGEDGAILDSPHDLRDALADLPIGALRVDPDTADALREIGVERIGELDTLPRGSLATRFGADLLMRIDQMYGSAFEPIDAERYTEPLRVTRAFAGPVTNPEGVMLTTRQLVDELTDRLAGEEAGVTRLLLALERVDAAPITHAVPLSHPTRDRSHLWTLLRPVVEHAHLGHGVEHVTLVATHTARVTHRQAALRQVESPGAGDEASDASPRAFGRLIDHMTSRLGERRVRRVVPRPTHIPEAAFTTQPATPTPTPPEQQSAPGSSPHAHASVTPAARPSRIFRRPRPVDVMLMAPDGPVLTVRDSRDTRRIVTTVGPERIATPWWRVDPDRRPVTRDYFKLQDDTGRWWWVYRELETNRWFVHGVWS